MKLQSYKCHKVVQAAAIHSVTIGTSNVLVSLESEPDVHHPIDPEVFARSVPEKGDYLVKYDDGYISFSPKAVFEAGYSPSNENETMNFGEALHELKCGRRVAREGWNGKGIFIELQTPDEHSKMTSSYIFINTTGLQTENEAAPKSLVPWLASQTDMLADDWEDVG